MPGRPLPLRRGLQFLHLREGRLQPRCVRDGKTTVRQVHLQHWRRLHQVSTVEPCTLAQHARLLALPVAKLVGQSKIASNITLGKFIGLHHIQSSLLYMKNCGLQTSKHSFFRPYLKGLSRLVRRPKPQNSAISQPIGIRFGVSKHPR